MIFCAGILVALLLDGVGDHLLQLGFADSGDRAKSDFDWRSASANGYFHFGDASMSIYGFDLAFAFFERAGRDVDFVSDKKSFGILNDMICIHHKC